MPKSKKKEEPKLEKKPKGNDIDLSPEVSVGDKPTVTQGAFRENPKDQ